ncbi:hypothetical protein [Bhargavaea cecembensis]|uniref:hypothetical protein n=1 Tax=Bhargavaea cecembensis TaxID=394098 RepID=UPI00054F8235|nr:hypothetical protein [Bhargavaea cecembensis]
MTKLKRQMPKSQQLMAMRNQEVDGRNKGLTVRVRTFEKKNSPFFILITQFCRNNYWLPQYAVWRIEAGTRKGNLEDDLEKKKLQTKESHSLCLQPETPQKEAFLS